VTSSGPTDPQLSERRVLRAEEESTHHGVPHAVLLAPLQQRQRFLEGGHAGGEGVART